MVIAWFVGATLALTGIGIFVPPVWSSAHLRDPVRTPAVAVQIRHSCGRCTNVYAAFYDLDHVIHRVELHAPANTTHYRPGMTLVYSATDPSNVMALNSYNDGRGFDRVVGVPTTALILAVELLTAALAASRWLIRRRVVAPSDDL